MPRAEKKQKRVALVTGGAKRVGRAIVERLAGEGFDIAFTFQSSDAAARQLIAALKRRGCRAIGIAVDLTQADAATIVADQVRAGFDRLDVLVNSASIYQPSSLKEVTAEQMSRFWMIHVCAPMLLCRELGTMLRRSRGHVVNMVDLLAEKPWPRYLGHCASKAGLWNLTLGLAKELAPEVTVNGIAPGVVEWSGAETAQTRAKYLRRVPLGTEGSPRDVAEWVRFLHEDGRYITGQIIRLDGGRSAT